MSKEAFAYWDGDFRPLKDATVNIQSKALQYGLGCFEGIRGYWNEAESQLYLFRTEAHYRRLQQSCRILDLTSRKTVAEMTEATVELCRRNKFRKDVYVRPVVFCNSETLSPALVREDSVFAIYGFELGDYLDTTKGVTACVSSWRRVADNMIPARAKPTAAYLNSALARLEAKSNGYDEAIFLTNDGYVSEGSAEHLFLVRDGKLITPTAQEDNLEGITRQTLIEVVPKELGYTVVERRVVRTELYAADEAFFCGTGAQITPVVMIDKRQIGAGTAGPVTTALQELYLKIVRGRLADYAHWCTPVYKS